MSNSFKTGSIIILICGLFSAIHAQYALSVHLYSYQNHENLKHDGSKCESFHWAGDHCDPIFEICISSSKNKPCNIFNKKISFWKNTKTISTVLWQEFLLDKINTNQSFSFKVKVDDEDQYSILDHIAVFTADFQISNMSSFYQKSMDVTPRGLNVQLQLSASLKCAKNYIEPKCDMKLEDDQCNPRCDHGSCLLDKDRKFHYCSCQHGWTGSLCSFKSNNDSNEISSSEPVITLTQSNTMSASSWISTMAFIPETSKNDFNPAGKTESDGTSLSTTIIIIGLLLFLCFSVIALLIVIRNFQSQNKKHSIEALQSHRPLPPIFFKNDQLHHDSTFKSQASRNLKTTSNIDYEIPMISTNKEYDLCDPYEEPIINHMECLTSETDYNSQNSDEYLNPLKQTI